MSEKCPELPALVRELVADFTNVFDVIPLGLVSKKWTHWVGFK